MACYSLCIAFSGSNDQGDRFGDNNAQCKFRLLNPHNEVYMNTAKSLYETDFNLWLMETVNSLRTGAITDLDLENLAEEIEDMGNSRKDALESNLIRVLQHLLKWKYQPQKRTNSWKASITEHSLRLNKALKKSPSLKPYFESVFAECYQDARLITAQETGLEISVFSDICPFAPADVLNPHYLPED